MFQLSAVKGIRWEQFSLRISVAHQAVLREDMIQTCGRHRRSHKPRPPDVMWIGFRRGPGVKLVPSEAGADLEAVLAEVGAAAEEVLCQWTSVAAW